MAYAIAFSAAHLHERGQHTHTFTYAFHRAELVGAFFNGVFLLALGLSIFLQSLERFFHPEVVTSPTLVLIIGGVGLVLNILSATFVHDHHGHSHSTSDAAIPLSNARQSDTIHDSHNHRVNPPVVSPVHNVGLAGVLLHLLGDAINNIGVMVAAVIMMKTTSPQRFYADPAVSLGISLIIAASAVPMTYKSGRVLLEASPVHLDLAKVKEDLLSIPSVLSVHDLHVWHLSQTVILGSLHVCVPLGTSLEQWGKIEQSLQHCFEEYGISHVTISPEFEWETHTEMESADIFIGCRLPSKDEFGCAVDIRKRVILSATPV